MQHVSVQTSPLPQGDVDTTSDGPASTLEPVLANAGPHVARLVNRIMQEVAVRLANELPKVLKAAVCLTKGNRTKMALVLRVALLCPALPGKQEGLLCSSGTWRRLSSRPGLALFRRRAVQLSFCGALYWSYCACN